MGVWRAHCGHCWPRRCLAARAGHKVLTLGGAIQRQAAPRQPLRTDTDGFSLRAAVRRERHDRKRLEQLRRDITHSALSDERAWCKFARQAELRLRIRWRGRTIQLMMSPQGFMQRLAALVYKSQLQTLTTASRRPPVLGHHEVGSRTRGE
jgi:Putative transposase